MKGLESFHGPMSPESLARFYEAQLLWDEGMSETAANYIQKNRGRMAVLAGMLHGQCDDLRDIHLVAVINCVYATLVAAPMLQSLCARLSHDYMHSKLHMILNRCCASAEP